MKSLAELQAIKERMQNNVMLRANEGEEKIRVVVGMATCGIAAGARPVLNAFLKEIEDRRLGNVICTQTGCIGICRYEPVVEITTPDVHIYQWNEFYDSYHVTFELTVNDEEIALKSEAKRS